MQAEKRKEKEMGRRSTMKHCGFQVTFTDDNDTERCWDIDIELTPMSPPTWDDPGEGASVEIFSAKDANTGEEIEQSILEEFHDLVEKEVWDKLGGVLEQADRDDYDRREFMFDRQERLEREYRNRGTDC